MVRRTLIWRMTQASAISGSAPVAIVTGGGSGIGRAIARELAAMGYSLLLAGRRHSPLQETGELLTVPWLAVAADVSDPADCDRIFAAALDRFGRVDVLINCAAVAPCLPIAAHDYATIDRVYRTNAIAPAYFIALFARSTIGHSPSAPSGPGPCIINISSLASVDPFPGFFAYAGSKAALNLMTKVADDEGRQSGWRCFSIAPGAVETAMLRSVRSESELPRAAAMPPERIARLVAECVRGDRDPERGSTILVP